MPSYIGSDTLDLEKTVHLITNSPANPTHFLAHDRRNPTQASAPLSAAGQYVSRRRRPVRLSPPSVKIPPDQDPALPLDQNRAPLLD
jgi:hypothetical protein